MGERERKKFTLFINRLWFGIFVLCGDGGSRTERERGEEREDLLHESCCSFRNNFTSPPSAAAAAAALCGRSYEKEC